MITKSKATLTGIAALFALSALSSQAHAGGGLEFSPGSNQGPPTCQLSFPPPRLVLQGNISGMDLPLL
jgi:hypothetical protein